MLHLVITHDSCLVHRRYAPIDDNLTMSQLVPVVSCLNELESLSADQACVLHIVFRDASKGPVLLGQVWEICVPTSHLDNMVALVLSS